MRRYLKGQRVAHFIVLLATLLSLRPMSAALPDSLFFSFWHPGTGPQLNAQQGDTAALDGNIAAVGAPRDATGGYSSGVVKIYDAPGGALLFTLTNPAPANDDYFGNAIALSGPRLVVGAYGDDQGKIDSGSVFVFDLSSPAPSTPILTLTNPAPATSLFFGWDVAISGNLVVVGTPYDNAVVSNAGKAWVFNLAASTPTVPLLVLTNPSPAQYDNYGEVVAISGSRVLRVGSQSLASRRLHQGYLVLRQPVQSRIKTIERSDQPLLEL